MHTRKNLVEFGRNAFVLNEHSLEVLTKVNRKLMPFDVTIVEWPLVGHWCIDKCVLFGSC